MVEITAFFIKITAMIREMPRERSVTVITIYYVSSLLDVYAKYGTEAHDHEGGKERWRDGEGGQEEPEA